MTTGEMARAVVLGQAANVFACRSTTAWSGALGWTSNRLLLIAVGVEILLLLLFLYVPPLAAVLNQAPPTGLGWLVAVLAMPAALLVDIAHKRLTRSSRSSHTAGQPTP